MIKEIEKPNYSILAEIYDRVMHDVNYVAWTDYIDEIILEHHPYAEDILELACGTGTMALSMEEFGTYNITATDGSAEMIKKAQEKAKQIGSDVKFKTVNFLDINLDQTFDVVYMVFDSLNYLHSKDDIIQLHDQVKKVLNPDGIFIYDFTTPRNSMKAIRYLNNEESIIDNQYRYHRKSLYDEKNQIHTNRFEIEQFEGNEKNVLDRFTEEHQQKIYSFEEMRPMIKETDFSILKAYDGFELKPAHTRSLRITMVLQ
ncbi:MAG: class I SAM-dependent methyltransferase [Balneolaceae bacterium]